LRTWSKNASLGLSARLVDCIHVDNLCQQIEFETFSCEPFAAG
jgi:hypothetical protein